MAALTVMLASLALAAAPAAPALEGLRASLSDARAGDWVTYAFQGGSPRQRGAWRIAVVEETRDAQGREALWVEMELGTDGALQAPLLQARMRVAREQGAQPAVSALYLAIGLEPLREVDPGSLEDLFPAEAVAGTPPLPGVEIHHRAPHMLATAAGDLVVHELEVRARGIVVQRVAWSAQVPVLGLARWEVPAVAHKLEVSDFGSGATARIRLPDSPTPLLNVVERRGASP